VVLSILAKFAVFFLDLFVWVYPMGLKQDEEYGNKVSDYWISTRGTPLEFFGQIEGH